MKPKRKSPTKPNPTPAPKIKKVKLTESVVLHVEVPHKMIPAIVPGPDPHVVKIVPLPPKKVKGFWATLWSGE